MAHLRIQTAGESHGKGLIGIIEGLPAGLKLEREKIDYELQRRQRGYGRSDRMRIESDRIEILSGLRFGITLGSPLSLFIENKDWKNWQTRMGIWEGKEEDPVVVPRPGHADMAGSIKYNHHDLRNVLERASARETAMRVALGAILHQLLEHFGIWIGSHVIQIHKTRTEQSFRNVFETTGPETKKHIREMCLASEKSDLRSSDSRVEPIWKSHIEKADKDGDSVGGVFEVVALDVPVGLGSYTSWDRRLDAIIAGDMMSIPAVKAVEIGLGTESAFRFGSQMHDVMAFGEKKDIVRLSNRAGGIEGGVSNGEPILVRATMKPIPTLKKSLPSVNLKTGESALAFKERSDVCAVPAASVVGEAMLAVSLGKAFCEKYGGDSLDQMRKHYEADTKR